MRDKRNLTYWASRFVHPDNAVFLLLALLIVALAVLNPSFTEPGNFMRYLQRVAPIAIAAIGQYFVIVSGEFDLSMGSVVTAQVVMAGTLIGQDEQKALPVLVIMLVGGLAVGLFNGLVTTLLRVPSFIVTLGTMLILLGIVKYVTGGAASGNPADNFRQIGRGGFRQVPLLDYVPYSVLVLGLVIIAAVALAKSPFGRTLIGVGDNPVAAKYSGTRVWWVKTRAFMVSSLCATLSGVILVGYAGVHPSVGQGYEFTAITAVVLGGAVLGGGRGRVLGAAAGAAALEAMFMVMNFTSVPATYRNSVQGLIIILAVAYAAFVFNGKRAEIQTSPESPSDPGGGSPPPAGPPTNAPKVLNQA